MKTVHRLRLGAMLMGLVAGLAPLSGHAATTAAADIDLRSSTAAASDAQARNPRALPRVQTALDSLRATVPDVRARIDAQGRVRTLSSLQGVLSPARQLPAADIARDYLRGNLAMLGIDTADLAELRLAREAVTAHNGSRNVRLMQQVDGIDVWRGELSTVIDREGRVRSLASAAISAARHKTNLRAPLIDVERAYALAIASAGMTTVSERRNEGLVYFPLSDQELRLAWQVTVSSRQPFAAYVTVVDAADGRVLWRRNGVASNHIDTHGAIFDREGPIDFLPFKTSPPSLDRVDRPFHGAAQLFPPAVGVPMFADSDPHYDWWAGQARTATSGNNVIAQDDRDDNNTGGSQATANGSDFTQPLDLSKEPNTYTAFSTTNIFWWVNYTHDVWYLYGFTEAFGNYQQINFVGGVQVPGNDPVIADSQNGADTGDNCNANFDNSPPDGSSGRMQMYECANSVPSRDSGLNSGTIVHEYHHGMSERLRPGLHTGQQGGGIGEGGGDFQGLLLTARPEDDLNGRYGHSAYYQNTSTNRRELYSINPVKQPNGPSYTYGDIYVATGSPHPTGEIWAHAMWYARALLITRYGFRAGTETIMKLALDGYKNAASSPDFLDVRDAILVSDSLSNNGANRCLLWSAFARMGIGQSATSTGQNDIRPVEAFDVPGNCQPRIVLSPTTLDFGNVPVDPLAGESGARSLAFQACNTGNTGLFLTNALLASGTPGFSLVAPTPRGFPVEIAAGSCLPIEVRCDPATAGALGDTVRINSNDPATPTQTPVALQCTGAAPLAQLNPNPLVFGSVQVNEPGSQANSSEQQLQVRNAGTSRLRVDGIALEGVHAADFRIADSVPTLPTFIEPGAQFSFAVRFMPTAPGDRTAKVRVSTSSGALTADARGIATALPNLVITGLSNPPAAKRPGDSFIVTDTTRNLGLVTAGATSNRYLLSRDTLRDNGDVILTGLHATPALAAGGAFDGSVDLTIPTTTAPGSYFLLACADAGLQVTESDESDNCRAADRIAVALPDLTASNVVIKRRIGLVGFNLEVSSTVSNIGTVPAAATVTRYYLSRDAIKDPSDPLMRDPGAAPALAPGEAFTATVQVRPTTSAPLLGQYYVLVCSDDAATVSEALETNNCAASPTAITVLGGLTGQ